MKRTDDVLDYLHDVYDRSDRGLLPPAYGVFARTYHRITLEVVAHLGRGYFDDPSWLADLDVRFASVYLEAVEHPERRVAPWRIAFADAETPGNVMRHLLLGVNAHMTYDLCVSLLDGFVDDRARRQHDFDAVNRIMSFGIGQVQVMLCTRYPAWFRRADMLGLGVDELLTYDTFVRWRTRAWTDAMAILDGKLTREAVEARVARRARWIARLPF